MTPGTTCQHCQRALSADALACSLGCTYCRDCSNGALQGLCPSCGGALADRPPHRTTGGTTT